MRGVKCAIVIPARLESTRMPRKLLRDDTGRPLLAHTIETAIGAARMSGGFITAVYAAVDDEALRKAAEAAGAAAVMTRRDHASGSDRVAEVAAGLSEDFILNLQGDEPEVEPGTVIQAARLIARAGEPAPMGTLGCPIASAAEYRNPNVVKVAADSAGYALYFSRAPIPFDRDSGGQAVPPCACRHIGIYVYRREFLLGYKRLPPSPLETVEKLEQLRALYAGHKIRLGITSHAPPGIDTEEE
ncbi:MAG: 3-deoxy-manno-octulosonate cytidylyltransferase [Planctomycetota bacterium]|nr:3-deoxy-manno-octulosonate cytidylyltransferase [Planctomycetota bacterium]